MPHSTAFFEEFVVENAVVDWLKNTFNALTDVKFATTEPDASVIFQNHIADLVVETWMGGRLYVYLLDKEPKVRDLKATLKENSRSGIGTLFMMDAPLLPRHDDVIKVDDWQSALFHLNDTWIYTYQCAQDQQWSIQQVHFTPTTYADMYKCWHFTDFAIEACVVRDREFNEGIKGRWVIGDLASPQYKRRINYERVNHRYHYNTKQTHETTAKVPTDQLMKYYEMLGLGRNASEKEVKGAFRRMALKVHPDVSALPRPEAERRIKELNEAYEYIKEHNGWR
jgi:hypothetical protein